MSDALARQPAFSDAPQMGADLAWVDFGCGNGKSFAFANSLSKGRGIGYDISPAAVEACVVREHEALVGDVRRFEGRGVADVATAVDLLPEFPDAADMDKALVAIVRAARNMAVVQHLDFDEDAALARHGHAVPENWASKVRGRPTLATHLAFLSKRVSALAISGMAAFGLGRAPTVRLMQMQTDLEPTQPYRNLRVVYGRKSVARFRAGLRKAGTGDLLFLWEHDEPDDSVRS